MRYQNARLDVSRERGCAARLELNWEHLVDSVSDDRSDQDLARRALSDRAAFALLYDRYVTRIYRYCYRRLGNRSDAEDATSAVFVRALERLGTYGGGSFAAWMFAIARTTVANRFREQTPDSLGDRGDLPDQSERPDEVAIAAADASDLARLLSMLPEDQREVMELRLAGLKGAEIAETMDRSIAATKMLQLRAMKRLRAAAESLPR